MKRNTAIAVLVVLALGLILGWGIYKFKVQEPVEGIAPSGSYKEVDAFEEPVRVINEVAMTLATSAPVEDGVASIFDNIPKDASGKDAAAALAAEYPMSAAAESSIADYIDYLRAEYVPVLPEDAKSGPPGTELEVKAVKAESVGMSLQPGGDTGLDVLTVFTKVTFLGQDEAAMSEALETVVEVDLDAGVIESFHWQEQ